MNNQAQHQVLLTRPAGGNEALATRLRSQGYKVSIRPMLKLSALSDSQDLQQTATRLHQYQKIIFVSKSSVHFGMTLAAQHWQTLPREPEWLAVGPGTAQALRGFGIQAIYPESSGSEGLLNLPQLCPPVAGRVLIVRGRGGRELLFAELAQRGAEVEYWEVYNRSEVIHDDLPGLITEATAILQCTPNKSNASNKTNAPNKSNAPSQLLVVLTSMEMLEIFARQIGPLAQHCLLLVPSQRIADQARSYAFHAVRNVGAASEQALYDAILDEH